MSKSHTPGPWEVADGDAPWFITVYANGDEIAIGDVSIEDVPLEEASANARLIAAAPDLLAACREAAEVMRIQEERDGERFHLSAEAFRPMWDAARAALLATVAKATGGDPQ